MTEGEARTYGAKIVLLGHQSVGKTCLGIRYVENRYEETPPESTIGAAFMTKTLDLNKERVKFEIWDTAGQERFRSFAPMYYRNAAAAIVVYDVGSMDSFVRAQGWVDEMRAQQTRDTVIAFAGNKCDIPDATRQVTKETGAQYAKEKGLLFFETSAVTGQNVSQLFEELARRVPKDKALNDRGEVYPVDNRSGGSAVGGKKSGCC